MPAPETVRVVGLYAYPVKSCRAVELEAAPLYADGLPFDREWLMVNASGLDGIGRFITQRTHPRLARVVARADAAALTLESDGLPPLRVVRDSAGPRRLVEIWDDRCEAIDAGDDAAAWCSAAVGAPVRLVRAHAGMGRAASVQWSGEVAAPVRFPDGFPLLVVSVEALVLLNSKLAAPLPMSRFRPNIVVAGLEAHVEDRVRSFRCGALALRPVKGCTRCSITTMDQERGTVSADQEPLTTLKSYRWNRELRGVTFGQNVVVADGVGTILRVGDVFEVERR